MSRENVELARRGYDAFNRRDLDAFLELMDEDVEGTSVLVAIEGEQNGHEGIRRWWENLLDVFSDFFMEAVSHAPLEMSASRRCATEGAVRAATHR